ncbi:hypothetical protein [Phenylobacterium sp.]|uniref:hypothetical protein n=1 Tax=Phenylobacterium sp. TaxID=1871053 RepID=UPI0030F4427A
MNKTALILAGALTFDLGVLVVGVQAAEAPKSADAAPGLTVRKAGEKPIEHLKIKMENVLISGYAIDRSAVAKTGCELKHGKVIDVAGSPICQLSSTPLAR